MKLPVLATLAAVSGLSLTLAAAAAAQPRIAQPRVTRGDANADGRLSLAEFQGLQGVRLMRLDGDGDGKISAAEWAAQRRGPNANPAADPAKVFARMDRNKDGGVDRAEVDALLARRFARLDADRDGQLTAVERRAQGGGPLRGRPAARAAARL